MPEYLPGRGITKARSSTIEAVGEVERFRNVEYYIEHYSDYFQSCGKCFWCSVASGTWARTCPSGELRGFLSYYPAGKNLLLESLMKGEIELTRDMVEVLYCCTLCGNCQEQCDMPWQHTGMMEWFEAFRKWMVERGIGPMPEHIKVAEHIERVHNPLGEPHEDRLKWLPFNKEELPKKADIVYFVGCMASYRQSSIAKAVVEILKKAGVDFTIMGEEWCCGYSLQKLGYEDDARKTAVGIVQGVGEIGASTVVTSCADGYGMFKKDYRERYGINYDFSVIHLVDLLLDLIDKGKLKLTKSLNRKVTYHDPCLAGRYTGYYEPPRELLKRIPGVELVEMERNRENAWCCGAGGGAIWAFPDLTEFAGIERIKEAEQTGANVLVSICPYCATSFKDAIKKYGSKMEMLDVAELVKLAME